MSKYCPECGAVMNSNHCRDCGYREKVKPVRIAVTHCEFTHGNKCCPATATITSSINGQGTWYCSAHYRARHDHEKCKEILEQYLKNGVPIKQDWRDELLQLFQEEKYNADRKRDESDL